MVRGGLGGDFDSGADGDEIVELGHVGIPKADTAGAGGLADEVLAIGTVDVDVAVFARFVVIFLSVEPENASEDQILFFHRIGGFPDAAGGFACNKVGSRFSVIADLLTDPVPPEGGFVAVGFRTGAFLCG